MYIYIYIYILYTHIYRRLGEIQAQGVQLSGLRLFALLVREFARLAETRLAQNSLDYCKTTQVALK